MKCCSGSGGLSSPFNRGGIPRQFNTSQQPGSAQDTNGIPPEVARMLQTYLQPKPNNSVNPNGSLFS